MNKNTLKKIGKYTALAGATTVVGNANADIVYTDINPDTILTDVVFDVNMDNDAVVDFSITESTAYDWGFMQAPNGQVAATNTGYVNAFAYSSGSIISSGISWSSATNNIGLGYGTSSGNFLGAVDKYIAVKFDVSGNTHYGWIRVDMASNSANITVKDYAYSDIVGGSIMAGQMPTLADTAQMVMAADISDNVNPTDLEVTFNMATNENTLSEYRVFIVKTANVGAIDMDSARMVTNYATVATAGSASYSYIPTAAGTDIDGDSIMQGVSYTAFVLSVPDGSNATNHSLMSSNPVTLSFTAGTASNLMASDASDNYDATDFNVAFDMAADESFISEYRVYVLKSASAATFDLAAADASSNYVSVGTTGSNISQVLPITAVDNDGDAIVVDVPYKFFVYSAASGGAMNSISAESNEVTLSSADTTVDAINNMLEQSIVVTNNESQINIMSESNIKNVSVISLNGEIVVSENVNNTNTDLFIGNLPIAMYMLVIQTNEGTVTKKFVK